MPTINRRNFLAGSAAATMVSLVSDRDAQAQNERIADPLYFKTASQLSSLLSKGDVSSEEVVRAVIERQQAVNDRVNAIVYFVPVAQAVEEAKASDQRRATGQARSPIDGIPFTMKDNIETADIPTTNGCPELKHYLPKDDASLVRRIKEAGAILLGKTNVPEMCMDGETDNVIFGRTKNPYDSGRVPGGSSGGEAAIIALGGSPFGVGTDIGGSIRDPSHCCGIAGIKPTTGRVADTGMFASFHPSVWHWNGIGPMARSVEDLALVLAIISGPDGKDPKAVDIPLRDHRQVAISRLKILAIPKDGYTDPGPATQRTFTSAVATLKEAGMAVNETVLPFFHTGFDRWVFSQIPEWATAIRRFRKEYATLGGSPEIDEHHFQIEWLLQKLDNWSREFDEERRIDEQLALHEFRVDMTEAFRDFDAIIMPVANGPAGEPTTKDQYDELLLADFEEFKKQGMFTCPFNTLGWPAAVVRCGTSDEGLPIGLQIVAKPWREDIALAVAAKLESQLGGWKSPAE